MEKRYKHIYRGIIIQNDDPSDLGRVKVFVPEVSITLFKEWNTKLEDLSWNTLGENVNSSITPNILYRLKSKLPWSHVIQPVIGGNSGNYWSERDKAYVTNSSFINPEPPTTEAPESHSKKEVTPTKGSGGSSRNPTASNLNIPRDNGPPEKKQAFITTNSNTSNVALVDPNAIPYGSIIELAGKQYVAGSTSTEVINRTIAKQNGDNSPVISLPNANGDLPFGNHPVIVYPYTGNPKSLDIPKVSKDLNTKKTTQTPAQSPSIFSEDAGEVFEVKLHYNRDGSIRSFSKSSNIDAIVGNSGDILLIDPSTQATRLLNIPTTKDVIVDDYFPTLSNTNPQTPKEIHATRLHTTSKVVSNSKNISIINRSGNSKNTTLNGNSVQNIITSNGTTYLYTNTSNQSFTMNMRYGDNGIARSITTSDGITTKTNSKGEIIAYGLNNTELLKIPSNRRSNLIDHIFPNTPLKHNTSNVPPFAVTPDSINQSNFNVYQTDSNKSAIKQFKSNGGSLSPVKQSTSALSTSDSGVMIPPTPITQKDGQGDGSHIQDDSSRTDKNPNLNQGGGDATRVKAMYGSETPSGTNTKGANSQIPWRPRHGTRSTNLGNTIKGIVTIPEVQSHVWVMFERGDPNYPIVVGTMFNQDGITAIFRQEKEAIT